ncbi:hypothetical protein TEA_029275 [Camellia sinensis var. sinensis]|uniref:ABC transporter domain-containing protein n=1 Tax=Camellia sinensis var. sinensis TaxID=542762 RepID=A0A4S4ERX4_CAMSN|nr:hypothetical protein TEA_029275 [Camellia sinensis var. sinensis]
MKEQGAIEDWLMLLKGISGAFRPSVLTALMVVSGTGKTTLIDVLAGRKTRGYVEGKITISGYPKKQEIITFGFNGAMLWGSEMPQKQSSRGPLRGSSSDSDPLHYRPVTDKSSKLGDRRSPRGAQSDLLNQKKLGTRIADLESQLGQAQEELKIMKEQLASAEASKKEAQKQLEKKTRKLSAPDVVEVEDKHPPTEPSVGGYGGFVGSPGLGDDSDDGFGRGKRKGSGIRMFGDLLKKKGQK